MRRATATPCPVLSNNHDDFTNPLYGDETANLEYTTAFHASFRQTRPKRRQIASEFTIHEDIGARSTKRHDAPPRLSQPAKRKLLPVPTTATENPVRSSPIVQFPSTRPLRGSGASIVELVPQRSPGHDSRTTGLTAHETLHASARKPVSRLHATRRQNLYIPSEDTTQPTMWMGIFSPVKQIETQEHSVSPEVDNELTGIAARMAEKRQRGRGSVQAQAKRMPLQRNTTAQAQNDAAIDHVGSPTGKENMPPGYVTASLEMEPQSKLDAAPSYSPKRPYLSTTTTRRISKTQPACLSSPELENVEKHKRGVRSSISRSKPWNAGPRQIDHPLAKPQIRTRKRLSSSPEARPDHRQPIQAALKVPPRFVQSSSLRHKILYPQIPISDHIQRPEMYEDDWLGQQEIAVTQLINTLFEHDAQSRTCPLSQDELRSRLLQSYSSSEITLLHTRLQLVIASGGLSLSRAAVLHIDGLSSDVGRRKAFVDFWLMNFNHQFLQVALEVVVGQQLCLTSAQSFDGMKWTSSSRRIALRLYIEAFLIRNEDINPELRRRKDDEFGANRTLLRCLMLIKALDLCKDMGIKGSETLFKRKAAFKSSIVAVQNLLRALNPSAGDGLRTLNSIGYEVSHEQSAIEEVQFRINNIEIDLRDGILLTKLVEVLLSSYTHQTHALPRPGEETTILTAEGDTILIEPSHEAALMRHVKVPASSRAVQSWNVSIAFGALANIDGMSNVMQDISPEDIVDGHREKSMKLLWTLTCRWGLPFLLDWNDVGQEIRRLSSGVNNLVHGANHEYSQQECETLLKTWTRCVAASQGETMKNFSTSFADGRIFQAVLTEYIPYLEKDEISKHKALDERLVAIGCNKQFSSLFNMNVGRTHIFGEDFVLAALAFLCSRLLGPSKLTRNAIKIQRQWRQYWGRIQTRRKAQKQTIAVACAEIVNAKGGKDAVLSDDRTANETDIWLAL